MDNKLTTSALTSRADRDRLLRYVICIRTLGRVSVGAPLALLVSSGTDDHDQTAYFAILYYFSLVHVVWLPGIACSMYTYRSSFLRKVIVPLLGQFPSSV